VWINKKTIGTLVSEAIENIRDGHRSSRQRALRDIVGNTRERPVDCGEIRTCSESWVIHRDSGAWKELAGLWHDNGRIVTTWCECSASEFVERCRCAWERGAIRATHRLGGTHVDPAESHAVAHTKMVLLQRADVNGSAADVTRHGRFYDFMERRAGRWGLVLRHPIYDWDRIDAVNPNETLTLDSNLLAVFPEGYRYLGYVQALEGVRVNRNLPGRMGPWWRRCMRAGAAG
jgi:hypothetical protein